MRSVLGVTDKTRTQCLSIMPDFKILDAHKIDTTSFDYIYEQNAVIKLKDEKSVVRCNIYRPKDSGEAKFPVLVTYGPYGKDVHYSV